MHLYLDLLILDDCDAAAPLFLHPEEQGGDRGTHAHDPRQKGQLSTLFLPAPLHLSNPAFPLSLDLLGDAGSGVAWERADGCEREQQSVRSFCAA